MLSTRVRWGRPDVYALSVILGNVYRLHTTDPNLLLGVQRRNNSYPSGPYNPILLGTRAIKRGLELLMSTEVNYIEHFGGNHNREVGNEGGTTSRYRATARFIEDIERYLQDREASIVTPRLTGNTLCGESPMSPNNHSLFQVTPLPIIRLKDEHKDLIVTPDTLETKGMEERLSTFNNFQNDHWIDLLVSDEQFKELYSGTIVEALEEEDDFGDSSERSQGGFDLLYGRDLYRVLNNNTFDNGGRFYGGWWQGIKSDFRKYITINWYTTREVDYSNLQAAMLYAREGEALPDDAYSIEGIPNEYRKLIKRSFFKLINATGRIRAPTARSLPEGWTWTQLLDALREKHRAIERHFNTGIGIELQAIDSLIAEGVMTRMMDERILVLPVHDSFIVKDGHENKLMEIMAEEYKSWMQQNIGMEPSHSWADDLPAEAFILDAEGVFDIADNIGNVEDQPEYAIYKQRKVDFVGSMEEAWGHRHSWYN